jgi:histidinol-phosphate aminotransferase
MFNTNLNNLLPYEIPPETTSFKYKLDINENQSPHSIQLYKSLSKHICDDLNRYQTKNALFDEANQRIVDYLNTDSNETDRVSKKNVLLTHGSDNALKLICETYNDVNMNVLILYPTYPHFKLFINAVPHNKIEYLSIELTDTNADILKKITTEMEKDTYHLVYIIKPNMPLGYSLTTQEIETLLKTYSSTKFIIDEAYIEYSDQLDSCVRLISQYENVIITRTFSKFFGLPSMRIGYVVSHPKNIEELRILHNGKDILQISLHAVIAVLSDLPHYNQQITSFKKIRHYLKDRMSKILEKYPKGLIQGYSMKDGMFFLLFSSDPQLLTALFLKHGIIIRNKHEDIPGAVRVSLPTEAIMVELMDLSEKINAAYYDKTVFQEVDTLYIDLDKTIRPHCHWDTFSETHLAVFQQMTQKYADKKIVVLTNNTTHSIKEISEKLHFPSEQIISPLSILHKYVEKTETIYLIGNESNELYLREQNYKVVKTYDETISVVLILNHFFLTIEEMATIGKIFQKKCKIIVAENTKKTDLIDCSDYPYDEENKNIIIPDVGSIAELFKNVYAQENVIVLGKPNTALIEHVGEKAIIIGDSLNTDIALAHKMKLAHKMNFYGFLVDPTKPVGYDYNLNCYIIHHLSDLL